MKENDWAIEALNQMTKCACHLCGEVWSLPLWIAEAHDADHPWECPNCRKLYETIGKSI